MFYINVSAQTNVTKTTVTVIVHPLHDCVLGLLETQRMGCVGPYNIELPPHQVITGSIGLKSASTLPKVTLLILLDAVIHAWCKESTTRNAAVEYRESVLFSSLLS